MFGVKRSWTLNGGWCEALRWDMRFLEAKMGEWLPAGVIPVIWSSPVLYSNYSCCRTLYLIFGKCNSFDFLYTSIRILGFFKILLFAISLVCPSISRLTIELSKLPFLLSDRCSTSWSSRIWASPPWIAVSFLFWLISGRTSKESRWLRLTSWFLSWSLRSFFLLSLILLTWAMECDRRFKLFKLFFELLFFKDFCEFEFSILDLPLSADLFVKLFGLYGYFLFYPIVLTCIGVLRYFLIE